MINEDNFIQGLKSKDLKSLDYLVENYSDLALKISYSILNNRQLSEECTNDILLKIWDNIDSFKGNSKNFAKWFVVVTKRHAIDVLRREKRHRYNLELKEDIKKKLRKKIAKRRNKRKGLVASIALVLTSVLLFSNASSVIANVVPTFNKIYESIGFKSKNLPHSIYIGKTYEENGIKVTLENLVGTKHVIKVSIKVEYSDKWKKSERPLVYFAYGFQGKLDTGSSGGLKNIDENTELMVLDFSTDKELPSKGNFEIKAMSDGFKKPLVWNMNLDFSKNFKDTIEKQVNISKNIGVNINHIEANILGIIIKSNNWLVALSNRDTYYLKLDNKIYPIFGSEWTSEKEDYIFTFLENVNYNSIKNSKNISLIKHSIERSKKIDSNKMVKEEEIKYYDKIEKQLNNIPKEEDSGVVYTKNITFNNGNRAEIYNIERKGGKIRVYVKGDDKKQVFNMFSFLYTSTGILVQSIEETNVGYIGEFNDISKNKVTIKMNGGILECEGIYKQEESNVILK
ncbi:RNA polymerase factor sigma-70 [Clostridium botulinum]|nr:RNA polymerase factor sigma-70 [Clostridium botulinum]